jgi:hypothetical protein
VDDQPTPIVKLPQACEYSQLLSNFIVEHPSKFFSCRSDARAIFYG